MTIEAFTNYHPATASLRPRCSRCLLHPGIRASVLPRTPCLVYRARGLAPTPAPARSWVPARTPARAGRGPACPRLCPRPWLSRMECRRRRRSRAARSAPRGCLCIPPGRIRVVDRIAESKRCLVSHRSRYCIHRRTARLAHRGWLRTSRNCMDCKPRGLPARSCPRISCTCCKSQTLRDILSGDTPLPCPGLRGREAPRQISYSWRRPTGAAWEIGGEMWTRGIRGGFPSGLCYDGVDE